MELRKCVLCFNECSPNDLFSESGDVLKLERKINEARDDIATKNQLEIKFLLRKILEVPQDKYSNLLVDYGNPCSSLWINCCDSCSVSIGKGKLILDQIIELQNQFEKLQNEIKHTITSSVFEEKAEGKYSWGIQEQVRSLITKGASNSKVYIREEKVENFSYSDLNVSSEQLNSIPGGSSLSSDFVYDQWSDVEESSCDEDDQDNSQEQDPIGLGEENDNFHFTNVVDIKTETISCNLFEDEQTYQEEQILPSEVNSDSNTNGDINDHLTGNVNTPLYALLSAGGITYNCDICGKSFGCADRFKDHKNGHALENIPTPHKCVICGKCFLSASERKVHERIHTRKKPIKCHICGQKFTLSSSLRRHERNKHKINHKQCSTSAKSLLAQSKEEKKHEKEDTEGGEKCFECHMCGKMFNSPSRLKKHEINHAEASYKCFACDKRFRQSNNLKRHERLHTGERPYHCATCEMKFPTSTQLNSHEKVHSEDRPFKCSVCGRGFKRPGELKAHKKLHEAQKHKCLYCEKTFSKLSALKCHERCHTTENPYKCPKCGKNFPKLSSLKCHHARHIEENPVKCDICGEWFKRSSELKSHTLNIHGFWR